MMKNYNSFLSAALINIKLLITAMLVLAIIVPFLSSCNRMLQIPGQSSHLPSAYTHSGKYVKKAGFQRSHTGVKKYALKCPISPAKK